MRKICSPIIMEVEQRKRSIPGAREIVMQIRNLSDSIQSTEDEIKECLNKISMIYEKQRAESPRGNLSNEFRVLNDILKGLKAERRVYYDQLESHKTKIEQLKESNAKDRNSINVKSLEDIDNKIQELNDYLIANTVSAKEEKKIAADLALLRSMKSKLGGIEDNYKQIRTAEAEIKEVRAKISELSQVIAEKTLAKDNIKAELDKLSEASKVKSPEVAALDARVSGLKAKKTALLNQKNEKKEEIRILEEEYAKFEKRLIEQQKLEEKKDSIKSVIRGLKNKKDALQAEIVTFDPKIFDSLYYTVSLMRNSANVNIDINLASQLLKHGITIPSNAASVETALEELKAKKNGCMDSFNSRKAEVDSEVAEIDAKIAVENAKLNDLPATDYEILKKASRTRRFNN